MDNQNCETTAILKKLISFNSVTPDNSDCLGYIENWLKQKQFTTQRMVFGPDKGSYKVDNLWAVYGNGNQNLCFAGHTDVVPPGNETQWSTPPFLPTIIDGKIYGRGACDMKGAIAAFMGALLELDLAALAPLNKSISMLLTGDEEAESLNGTEKVLQKLTTSNQNIDLCLVGEPTSKNHIGDQIKIGRRGSYNAKITIHGKQGHAAYHKEAINPAPIAGKIINALTNLDLNLTTPQQIKSNLAITGLTTSSNISNIIPQTAEIHFNIRYNNQYNVISITKLLKDLCKDITNDFELTIIKADSKPFMCMNNEYVEKIANLCHKVTNINPKLSTDGGTSDARFFSSVCPTVEIGLVNTSAHQLNEYASIKDIIVLKNIYLAILKYWKTK